jgi:hypothetical protein
METNMAEGARTLSITQGQAKAVDNLAQEVQTQSSTVNYLLLALDDALEDLAYPAEDGKARARQLEAIERSIVYCRLAREAARRASEAGEQIERAMYPVHMSTKAAAHV